MKKEYQDTPPEKGSETPFQRFEKAVKKIVTTPKPPDDKSKKIPT